MIIAESTAAARTETNDAAVGSLLGTAVGDALGLPYENLSPRRARTLLGTPDRYRFFFRWGFVSDDTEHSCIIAQAAIAAAGDPERFEREVARRMKWWFLKLPAGIGRATARSMLKLWFGFSSKRSGVYSAGNGPAMRAPILGALIQDDATMVEFVRRSSRITHSDVKAEYGAIAVALAARQSRDNCVIDGRDFLGALDDLLPSDEPANELRRLLLAAVESTEATEGTREFAARTFSKRGVSGYTYDTVPAAIHSWLTSPNDFERAVTNIVECGGDADSTAAIVGGIIGARVSRDAIPARWLSNLKEWPCSVAWMESLARNATTGNSSRPPRTPVVRQLIRNIVFLAVVLIHGFRRLAPPY